jgi:hypothetical protein
MPCGYPPPVFVLATDCDPEAHHAINLPQIHDQVWQKPEAQTRAGGLCERHTVWQGGWNEAKEWMKTESNFVDSVLWRARAKYGVHTSSASVCCA